MEKLQRRSDGIYETPSGLFGVEPLRGREYEDGLRRFKFVGPMAGPTITVEWQGPIAVIASETALAMVGYGYARHITDEQMEEWNSNVEMWLEAQSQENQGLLVGDNTPTTPESDEGDDNQSQNDTGDIEGVTTDLSQGQSEPVVEGLTDGADTTDGSTTSGDGSNSDPDTAGGAETTSEQSPDTGAEITGSRKKRK